MPIGAISNNALSSNALSTYQAMNARAPQAPAMSPDDKEARATFDQFVGEAFYGQMLSSMRKTVEKPAYFHGGRAEEMFQSQMDQYLAQDMARSNAGNLTEGMYQLFRLTRS